MNEAVNSAASALHNNNVIPVEIAVSADGEIAVAHEDHRLDYLEKAEIDRFSTSSASLVGIFSSGYRINLGRMGKLAANSLAARRRFILVRRIYETGIFAKEIPLAGAPSMLQRAPFAERLLGMFQSGIDFVHPTGIPADGIFSNVLKACQKMQATQKIE